jgi:hypothetical protein
LNFPSLGISAEIDVEVGDDDRAKLAKEAALKEWNTPRILRLPFGTTIGATNYTAVLIGDGPASRRKWNVKRFACGMRLGIGNGLAASSGVAFFLYKYGFATLNATFDTADIDSADLLWSTTLLAGTVPIPMVTSMNWGENQLTLMYPEKLLFVALGFGTANINGVAFSGNAQIIDEPVYVETLPNLLVG